ncbi:MAG: hypothetical protein MUF13_09025 [Akkermansiaceae bacterium]|nr:hypothetical protein [Akkermansiaceae bacterium]
MLVLFLVMAGALFLGVMKFLKVDRNNPPAGSIPTNPPDTTAADAPKDAPATSGTTTDPAPKAGSETEKAPAPAPAPDKTSQTPKQPAALPTPASQQPTLIEPAPELPEGLEAKSPGMEALAVLEKFLTASSLAERLPLMETKTPEAELATSILSKPLPPAPKMLLEYQESNNVEGVVDFYYNVDFETDSGPNLQTILVRTRGGGEPKVVADPFLDLFGGRLAAYAAKPTDKAGEFQVIVSAVASCMDPKIPNREKKLTLKLLPRDNTKEIALAYFGKMSKIHEMLEDGTYSLSYGKAKSCTVMLRWNTEDNAEYPYLEAIALKALDWNP